VILADAPQAGAGAVAGAAEGAMLPLWITAPLAVVLMALVAGHILLMRAVEMPASRRRIRTANGAVILILLPTMAYALSVSAPDDQRGFVLTWVCVIGLLGLVIALAVLDILNSLRLAVGEAVALRRQARRALRADRPDPSDPPAPVQPEPPGGGGA
jgi:hypothetical protein